MTYKIINETLKSKVRISYINEIIFIKIIIFLI